jgi:hypothetical protein
MPAVVTCHEEHCGESGPLPGSPRPPPRPTATHPERSTLGRGRPRQAVCSPRLWKKRADRVLRTSRASFDRADKLARSRRASDGPCDGVLRARRPGSGPIAHEPRTRQPFSRSPVPCRRADRTPAGLVGRRKRARCSSERYVDRPARASEPSARSRGAPVRAQRCSATVRDPLARGLCAALRQLPRKLRFPRGSCSSCLQPTRARTAVWVAERARGYSPDWSHPPGRANLRPVMSQRLPLGTPTLKANGA